MLWVPSVKQKEKLNCLVLKNKRFMALLNCNAEVAFNDSRAFFFVVVVVLLFLVFFLQRVYIVHAYLNCTWMSPHCVRTCASHLSAFPNKTIKTQHITRRDIQFLCLNGHSPWSKANRSPVLSASQKRGRWFRFS